MFQPDATCSRSQCCCQVPLACKRHGHDKHPEQATHPPMSHALSSLSCAPVKRNAPEGCMRSVEISS